jgi:intermediate cleaving peptidase 55
LSEASEVYTDITSLSSSGSKLAQLLSANEGQTEIQKILKERTVKPLRPILNELRVFKSESEVVNLRQTGQASGRAFTESMRHGFSMEKDLAAFIQYQFKVNGCDGSAFVPVVGGGRVRAGDESKRCRADRNRMALVFIIPEMMMSYGDYATLTILSLSKC